MGLCMYHPFPSTILSLMSTLDEITWGHYFVVQIHLKEIVYVLKHYNQKWSAQAANGELTCCPLYPLTSDVQRRQTIQIGSRHLLLGLRTQRHHPHQRDCVCQPEPLDAPGILHLAVMPAHTSLLHIPATSHHQSLASHDRQDAVRTFANRAKLLPIRSQLRIIHRGLFDG